MINMNVGQQIALKALKSGENVFLSGEGGTGKSYVLNRFLKEVEDKNIIVCAPTGNAAINIGGSTLHRVFNIPVRPIGPMEKPLRTSEILQKADIIIIDEISMCRFDCFEYVAKSILLAEEEAQKKIDTKGEPSKQLPPKQLIVVGDFLQLPPVIMEKDRTVLEKYWGKVMNIGDGFAFQAPMWKEFHFVTIVLDEVVRQKELDFVTNLNKIRRGDRTAIAWFNEHAAKRKQKGIHLCATNKAAEQINLQEARKIKGRTKTYYADIKGTVGESDKVTSDELKLKVGMQVISLVNDLGNRYQNGTMGIIKKILPYTVEVDFGRPETVEIVPYTWEVINYKITNKNGKSQITKEVIGTFCQLPLKVAYAITIHKSQGQTYDVANISPDCFATGQLYVALSRVRSIKRLHLNTQILPNYLITSQAVLNFYAHGITTYKSIEQDSEPEKSVTKSNTTQGGTRKGAGRKSKYGYGVETCTIRIPKSAKEAVQAFLSSKEWE